MANRYLILFFYGRIDFFFLICFLFANKLWVCIFFFVFVFRFDLGFKRTGKKNEGYDLFLGFEFEIHGRVVDDR